MLRMIPPGCFGHFWRNGRGGFEGTIVVVVLRSDHGNARLAHWVGSTSESRGFDLTCCKDESCQRVYCLPKSPGWLFVCTYVPSPNTEHVNHASIGVWYCQDQCFFGVLDPENAKQGSLGTEDANEACAPPWRRRIIHCLAQRLRVPALSSRW